MTHDEFVALLRTQPEQFERKAVCPQCNRYTLSYDPEQKQVRCSHCRWELSLKVGE